MNNQLRHRLGELIDVHGRGVVENVGECEILLRDLAKQYRVEVHVLTLAVREGVTRTMVAEASKVPWALLKARMVKRLKELAIADEAAEWAVDSWAVALGIITEADVEPGRAGPGPSEPQEAGERRPCPYCNELILAGALRCRFCRSDLAAPPNAAKPVPAAPEKPGVIGLVVLNLMAPGFGTWRCGRPWRGALIMVLIGAAMLIWTLELVKPLQDAMQAAMMGGRGASAKAITKIVEDACSGWAYTIMYWLYIYSFFDIWLVYPRDPKKPDAKRA